MSERVAIAAALKEEIKAKVGERRGRPAEGDSPEIVENFPQLNGQKTRDVVAEKAGFGNETTFRQAEKVVAKGHADLVKAMDHKHQRGRRNSTPEELSYLRGKRYEAEKKPKGGNRGNQHTKAANHQSDDLADCTHERLAAELGVSGATIQRDAAYARAVDTVAENVGDEARTWIDARR